MRQTHDLILVGTGFASSFFLMRYLRTAPPGASVLVLERGRVDSHAWQFKEQRNSSYELKTHVNKGVRKTWLYTIGFGGGSNCWWACTPRMLPNDFRTRTVYGVGRDWPLDYEELEPFYQEVEEAMAIAGSSETVAARRSAPFPQPPHRLTDPDRLLAAAYPGQFFPQPTARARRATKSRPPCCATGTCSICPIDAKFTVQNELGRLYQDERVQLRLGATAYALGQSAGEVDTVLFEQDGEDREARGELIVLGANALFNALILQASGDSHPLLGRRLCEQVGQNVFVYLDGIDNYQGSTSVTGHGYMLYDGEHRRTRAGCLMETFNVPKLRAEQGRWRQTMELKFIFEDLPSDENRVTGAEDDRASVEISYAGHSPYAQRGLDTLEKQLPELLRALPVEEIRVAGLNATEAHILGTTVMGDDPARSVLDRHQVHHRWRNLLVLGSGSFPTCPPANPTLTLSALALHAAQHALS